MKKRLLFVCTINRFRSKTAEQVFETEETFDVRSCGTDESATKRVDQDLLDWADVIFVMEKRHRNFIGKNFRSIYKTKPVVCLNIPDEFELMDAYLVKILQSKVNHYFLRKGQTRP